ncbi:hypothetical protein ACWDRB_27380 [Nonomuraea sp. NPDC003707]
MRTSAGVRRRWAVSSTVSAPPPPAVTFTCNVVGLAGLAGVAVLVLVLVLVRRGPDG